MTPSQRESYFAPLHDLPAISRTILEAFRNHWGFVKREHAEDVSRYRQSLDDDPDIDPAVWHVAQEEGEVVGVCLGTTKYSGDENQAYIFTLGVRDRWRGRGIGRALLVHAFATFYRHHRTHVDLDVDTNNLTGALKLYEGVGMVPPWRIDEYHKQLR
ncbi:GNAT family N-acetyltransferase [Candidatus Bipolaricaulota bacterium]|nr:GNAT family N-acetyltransferase [Candidatus Bipolaricaulota bacterium]